MQQYVSIYILFQKKLYNQLVVSKSPNYKCVKLKSEQIETRKIAFPGENAVWMLRAEMHTEKMQKCKLKV